MPMRTAGWTRKKWSAIALFVVVIVLVGLFAYLDDSDNGAESAQRPSSIGDESLQTSEQAETNSDEHFRALVLGTWEDDYRGHRTLTVRDDGTATMVVEPDSFAGKLFAKRMTFEEEWKIEDGHLRMKAVGGEPEARVKLILETMGDVSEQKILQLTKHRMRLVDADGTTEYDWRRPQPADE